MAAIASATNSHFSHGTSIDAMRKGRTTTAVRRRADPELLDPVVWDPVVLDPVFLAVVVFCKLGLVTFGPALRLACTIFRRPPVAIRRSGGRDVDSRLRLRADERGGNQAT